MQLEVGAARAAIVIDAACSCPIMPVTAWHRHPPLRPHSASTSPPRCLHAAARRRTAVPTQPPRRLHVAASTPPARRCAQPPARRRTPLPRIPHASREKQGGYGKMEGGIEKHREVWRKEGGMQKRRRGMEQAGSTEETG